MNFPFWKQYWQYSLLLLPKTFVPKSSGFFIGMPQLLHERTACRLNEVSHPAILFHPNMESNFGSIVQSIALKKASI